MMQTLNEFRQYELVILRRLREHPLTEFELAREVAEHSGYSPEEASELMENWLESLKDSGYIWSGKLFNDSGQSICAAALTRAGRELVA
jgi:DNA-binding PadR family transcriptional regulator